MVKPLTKVIYKPDSMSTDEFIMIVNAPEYKKWKEGDTTIPLADVVDAFTIFHSSQGKQGLLGTASKQQLENVFGTSNDTDAAILLLQKGTAQNADKFGDDRVVKNLSKGGYHMDIRGSGAQTSGA